MESLIHSNAAELCALQARVYRELKKGHTSAWSEACGRFLDSYDRLAFPGGLSKGMALLAKHDPPTIETAIRFLESDPWFFRSGYIKADLLKHLRHAPLAEEQLERLRRVILTRIEGEDRREFRWYCRLARVVKDPVFEEAVVKLSESSAEHVARHAKWVLTSGKPASKRRNKS